MHRIVFEAETVEDLVRQCKAFIGANGPSAPSVKFGTASAINTWPVPSWAPSGSRWIVKTNPPLLIGPAGEDVAVRWVAGTAQRPRVT